MIASSPSARAEARESGLAPERVQDRSELARPHQAFADLLKPSAAHDGDDQFARAFNECGLLGQRQKSSTQARQVEEAAPGDRPDSGEAAPPTARAALLLLSSHDLPTRPPLSASAAALPNTADAFEPTHKFKFVQSALGACSLQNQRSEQTRVAKSHSPVEHAPNANLIVARHEAQTRTSAVFIALVQTELGARLLARVGSLSADERNRLRAEIGELLAAYGLDAAIDIQTPANNGAEPSTRRPPA